jgi:aminopeptidase N
MKMKLNFILSFLLLCFVSLCNAQIQQLDVRHYKIDLSVNDLSDTIEVIETISFSHLDRNKPIVFNLKSVNADGNGMTVSSVSLKEEKIPFSHENDSLYVIVNAPSDDHYYELNIAFKGVPIDGLVIGKNKFGKRTFFGDNWPNRAQNWFACNDHLSDKSSVEFIVHVPQQYTVVSNGTLTSVKKQRKIKTYHYFSMVPIPTKVMVVGIAEFSSEVSGIVDGIVVQSFTYPENKKRGR